MFSADHKATRTGINLCFKTHDRHHHEPKDRDISDPTQRTVLSKIDM